MFRPTAIDPRGVSPGGATDKDQDAEYGPRHADEDEATPIDRGRAQEGEQRDECEGLAVTECEQDREKDLNEEERGYPGEVEHPEGFLIEAVLDRIGDPGQDGSRSHDPGDCPRPVPRPPLT